MTAAISGTTVKSLSKNRLRQLLSVDDKSVSETTFRRLCRQWRLAEVVGLEEAEFKSRKNFWGEEAQKLCAHLGIDELDKTPSV
jgi:hypothetical protein